MYEIITSKPLHSRGIGVGDKLILAYENVPDLMTDISHNRIKLYIPDELYEEQGALDFIEDWTIDLMDLFIDE